MSVLARIGLGLWTMQSTAAAPANPSALYRAFAEDAVLAEQLGFASLWMAQHRVWYDGWCPAPLHAQAFAAARTARIRFASSVLLLPQQDPAAFARSAVTLSRLSGDRLELGLGLGHRDAEYAAVGVSRARRGRLMDEGLARLRETWDGPVWIGGMSDAALGRAARGGFGLILPQSLTAPELAQRVAGFDGPVAVMRDVHVGEDDTFRARLDRHYREEIGAWWRLKGQLGFAAPEQLERQLQRIQECALVGPPELVAAGLAALFDAGADVISIRCCFDFVTRAELHEQMRRIALDVAPLL